MFFSVSSVIVRKEKEPEVPAVLIIARRKMEKWLENLLGD
jgi:hypothetical protein